MAGGLKPHHGGKAAAAAAWSLAVHNAASGCCCCCVQCLQHGHAVEFDNAVLSSLSRSLLQHDLAHHECMKHGRKEGVMDGRKVGRKNGCISE